MEYSIRYIPTGYVKGQPVGNKPALCCRDEDWAVGIINNDCVYCTCPLDLKVHDKSRFVPYGTNGEEYPVHKFVALIENSKEIPMESDVQELLARYHSPKIPRVPMVKSSSKKGRRKVSSDIKALAEEANLTPARIRKFLRSKGLNAPYSEKDIRDAIEQLGKSQPKKR